MKIGYPCVNMSVGCTANSTFRLASYTEKNLVEKVANNIDCLEKILNYNIRNNLLFFRISSDLVPFASHPICTFDWKGHFGKRFEEIGKVINENGIRISMHPDQFVLLNSPDERIIEKSLLDLKWHCEVMDLMGLDQSAKVQIHVGGAYGDKEAAVERFISKYKKLPQLIKKRLVIENDERLYSLKDCLSISKVVGVPIVFDLFHHKCLNNGESMREAVGLAENTWKGEDGILMSDYSSQEPGAKVGKHITHINIGDFRDYIKATKGFDFDIMLEIKDKEKSAIEALGAIK